MLHAIIIQVYWVIFYELTLWGGGARLTRIHDMELRHGCIGEAVEAVASSTEEY